MPVSTPASSSLQPCHTESVYPKHTGPRILPCLTSSSSFPGCAFLLAALFIPLLPPSLCMVCSKYSLSLQRTAADRKIRIFESSRLHQPNASVCHSVLRDSVISTEIVLTCNVHLCVAFIFLADRMERKHRGRICVLTQLSSSALEGKALSFTNHSLYTMCSPISWASPVKRQKKRRSTR